MLEAHLQDAVGIDAERWERVVAGLERDGLVHRADREIHLGAATIGP
jgi:hypothetical protein